MRQAARRLIEAAERFTVPLRMGDGMSEPALKELKSALSEVGLAWRDEPNLPKAVVSVLIALAPAIEGASYLYDEEAASRIRDVSLELQDLIFQEIVPT
jgi:hypothetical protein